MAVNMLAVGSGRKVEYSDAGQGARGTLVFHAGTPDGLASFAPFVDAAAAHGLRLLSIARPGYESSTRRRGRSVADVVDDVEEVLDHLDIDAYVSVGWSGGGPHALACRALSATRCRGAVLVASIAPCGVAGLDFFDGMGEDNAVGFRKAVEGEEVLAPYLEEMAPAYGAIGSDDLVASLETVLPDVDRRHLTGEFAGFVAEGLRRGVAHGIGGWLDDCLAFARPWGFDVRGVDRVSIWHGSEDMMVPFGHGKWLTGALGPGADLHLLEAEGHLSLVAGKVEEVVAEAARYLP